MLTHSEAQALISASLDQPLDPDIAAVLDEHLATCPECRYFAASSQRLASALESWPSIPESPAVRQGVWEAIESPAPWWQRVGDAFGGQAAAIASTAVVALLVIALATLAIVRLNDNGDDEGARLAAGTSEAIALATATPAPTETAIPTETPAPTATVAPTSTSEPTSTAASTETPAPTSTAPAETPVDLTGGGTAPAETPADLTATEAPEATAPPATSEVVPAFAPVTEEPAATETPAPTQTPVPPTSTPEPTATPSPTPAPTATPEPTATPSPTPEPTATPEPAPADFTVTLLDPAGDPVPNACWALIRDDETIADTCDTPDVESAQFASNGNAGFFDIPSGSYTLRMTSGPEGVTVPDRQVEIAPGSDDIETITATVATPTPEPTATPAPTNTPEPTSTPEPTATPEPTSTPEPVQEQQRGITAAGTPEETATQEETSPPIEPLDETVEASGGETATETAPPEPTAESTEASTSVAGPEQRIISPAEATSAAGGEPVATEAQVIEPIGGETTPAPTAQAETGDGTGATVPPEPGAYDLTDAPYYSDGQPWGDLNARLGFEGGNIVFTAMPDAVSLDGPAVQQAQEGDSTYLAVCEGDCEPATLDSGEGQFTDSPIGWVDGQLIYQRQTGSGEVELRALTWNGAPASDEQIGTAQTSLSPYGSGYEGVNGTLIPCAEGWLLVGNGEASVIDGNPYGQPELVRTNFSAPLIAYVAGGQLIIADQSAPGTPISTIPFSGVDFDISPDNDRVVISTGSGLQIWTLGGEQIGGSATTIQTGSVLWRSTGIVMLDLTNGVMRLVDPAELT